MRISGVLILEHGNGVAEEEILCGYVSELLQELIVSDLVGINFSAAFAIGHSPMGIFAISRSDPANSIAH